MTKTKLSFYCLCSALCLFNNSHATSNKEDYELQERCGKKSKEFFEQNFGNGISKTEDGQQIIVYSNHYNRKLNKCFIEITLENYVYKNNKPAYVKSFTVNIFDINENKEYGRFIVVNGEPRYCTILDDMCPVHEWDERIKPFMNE